MGIHAVDKNMKKYVLFPGYVYSKIDWQRHYINAKELAQLYKVNLKECLINECPPYWTKADLRKIYKDLIWLYPDFRGYYIIPKK